MMVAILKATFAPHKLRTAVHPERGDANDLSAVAWLKQATSNRPRGLFMGLWQSRHLTQDTTNNHEYYIYSI